jgi:antirestriction protein ArdC
MSRRDIHAEITARIIAAQEAGTPPWRRPWGKGGPAPLWPRNAVTGRPYRGINALLLAWHPLALAGGDPRWCTYNQARDKGWQVRKGEKGIPRDGCQDGGF